MTRHRGTEGRCRPARALAAAAVVMGGILMPAAPAAAHGIGGRSDLPLPLWMFTWGATIALVGSFVVLVWFWPRPRLARAAPGVALPRWAQRLARPAGLIVRLVGLVTFVVVVAAAVWGRNDTGLNFAPIAVYVVFWVGMQGVSALVGDLWRLLSPFESVAGWVSRRWGGRLRHRPSPGQWTAAVGLFSFVWLELAYFDASAPRAIGVWLVAYSAVVALGVGLWGRGWLRRGEGFAGLFGLIAHLAPFYWDEPTGRMRARVPGSGLATVEALPGTWVLLFVALGSTSFDGLTRTQFWSEVATNRTGWELTAVNTFGLVWVIGLMAVAYIGATRVVARIGDRDQVEMRDAFLGSLVPIIVGYTFAHYFSLLVFEGQKAIALASDPLGRGWDLFGTIDYTINYQLVTPSKIAYVQVGAIVVGHVVGVIAAHDRAVELWAPKTAVRTQYPMLAVMVLYTVGGLAVLLGG